MASLSRDLPISLFFILFFVLGECLLVLRILRVSLCEWEAFENDTKRRWNVWKLGKSDSGRRVCCWKLL